MVRGAHMQGDGRGCGDHEAADLQGDVGDTGYGDVRGGVVAHGLADDRVEVRGPEEMLDSRLLVAQHGENLVAQPLLDLWVPRQEVDGGGERTSRRVLKNIRVTDNMC